MKKIIKCFTFCSIALFCFALSSCAIDDCDVDCGQHGICDEADGSCACFTGYEVNADGKCDSVSRDKFIATYHVLDLYPTSTYNYIAEISPNPTKIDEVIITNYGGYNAANVQLNVIAKIDGNTLNVIADTLIMNNQSFVIFATSTNYAGENFSLTHTVVIDSTAPEIGTATYTKQ